ERRQADVVLGRQEPLGRGPPGQVERGPGAGAANAAPFGEQHPQVVADLEEAARLGEAVAARGVVEEVLPAVGGGRCDHRPRDHPGERRRDAVGARPVAARRIERIEPSAEEARHRGVEIGAIERDRLEQPERAPEPLGQDPVQIGGQRGLLGQTGLRGGRVVGPGRTAAEQRRGEREESETLHGATSGAGVGLTAGLSTSPGVVPPAAGGGGSRGCSGGSSGRWDSTSLASLASWAGSVHWPLPQVIDTTTPRSRTRKTSPPISPDWALNDASPTSSVARAPGRVLMSLLYWTSEAAGPSRQTRTPTSKLSGLPSALKWRLS